LQLFQEKFFDNSRVGRQTKEVPQFAPQTRNPKHEIRNKHPNDKFKCSKRSRLTKDRIVLSIVFSTLVVCFGFRPYGRPQGRASNFELPPCGYLAFYLQTWHAPIGGLHGPQGNFDMGYGNRLFLTVEF
jgi:hypothetical protein